MTRALLLVLLATPLHAADEAEARAVFEALHLPETIALMVEEGVSRGDDLALTLFPPGAVPVGWDRRVAALYDPDAIEAQAFAAFALALSEDDVAPMLAWLESEPGARLAALELSARAELLDPEVERTARGAVIDARARGSDRLKLIEAHVAAGDLVERNTMAGLNANLAFELAFLDGGGRSDGTGEAVVYAEVAAGEPLVRSAARDWAESLLYHAYAPASDADVAAATAFMASEPGQAMTDAVFSAFDDVFPDLSRALGQEAARAVRSSQT